MEEPLFCKGDKVVCIRANHTKGGDTNLIEGKVYTILDVERQCCGIGVDVGISTTNIETTMCECGRSYPNQGINWKDQNRFVPIDTDRALESEIFEALKGQKIVN